MDVQRINNLRLTGLLTFVAVMPVLALPAVNRRLDRWVFGGEELAVVLGKIREKSVERDLPLGSGGSLAEGDPTVLAVNLTREGLPASPSVVERLPPVDIPVDGDEFADYQKRLQDLGASYFCLEDTGLGGARYRFRCEFPLPGNSSYARPFESEDADPLVAIQAVVKEAESWVAAQQAALRRAAAGKGRGASKE
ncbi:MAG: hypothetical protein U1A77_16550 [Pirellulales bacterium]